MKYLLEYNQFNISENTDIKRYEIGSKLSDSDKSSVYKTMKDAYKVNHRPYDIIENEMGNDKFIWLENSTDYMVTSDITNRKLRWFITLPDGKIAHPTELYPNIKKSEIDHVQNALEYFQNLSNFRYNRVEKKLKETGDVEPVINSIETALKNGFTFKREFSSDDIGQKNPNVRLYKNSLGSGMFFTIPEYHINRGETYVNLNEDDLINHRTGNLNKWLHFELSEIDWERFYNENKI